MRRRGASGAVDEGESVAPRSGRTESAAVLGITGTHAVVVWVAEVDVLVERAVGRACGIGINVSAYRNGRAQRAGHAITEKLRR